MIKFSDIEVEYIDHMGSDASVSRAARVSFANDGKEFDEVKDTKLINYLAKHGHISPFHHTFITVRVKAPIFVRSQAVKHKFMPVNEVSRRYVSDEPEFYIPDAWRMKADNVKQGSSEEVFNGLMFINNDNDGDNHGFAQDAAIYVANTALEIYNGMLYKGICPEQARSVLPQSMMTTWYWSGTLSAFADMLNLRLDSHAQKEIQYMAQKIRDIIEPLYPVSLKALLKD
jgi:thymidylate synthase (FAD)